jgi:TorA maturation chaperone TorD
MTLNEQWRENRDEMLAGEFLLFGMLGKLLYNQPAQDEIAVLIEDEIFTDAPFASENPDVVAGLAMLQQWAASYAEDAGAVFSDLQVDWTRLFAGGGLVPIAPWESVYYTEERVLFSESTLDVRAWYRRFGLELANLHHEPDDHIGLEMLFIAHLARLGLAALEEGDEEALERAVQGQRDFCRQHLLVWAPTWSEQMVILAQTDFYRGLALIVRGALTELARLLDVEKARSL